ncbi:MAG: DUF4837 family protein [Gemmatimonadota bacterium]
MTRLSTTLLIAVVAGLAACDLPRAHGDATAVIVASESEFWIEGEEVFREQLEPTIQTVRNEHPYRLTHVDPDQDEAWTQLQRFRQVAVLGSRGYRWVDEALDRAGATEAEAPALVVARDVWAKGQQVWVLLLPDEDSPEAVKELAAEVRERMDVEFQEYARERMFVSGRDTILADSLAQNVGFRLVFPSVYNDTVHADTVFRFRNDNPSPTELIREVAVSWVEPMPEEDPTREELEQWRLDLTRAHYAFPQDLDTTVVSYGPIEVNGSEGVEFQSAWVSLPDAWPSGGPFIVRALRCPEQDRMYLMDAWVYAPNREKYEYVIQLRTILDSFRCS